MYYIREDREIIKIDQGDIFSSVKIINTILHDDEIIFDDVIWDKVIVLSQTCDLHREQENVENKNEILSVLVAPLFDRLEFMGGVHLLDKLEKENKQVGDKQYDKYRKLQEERYHALYISEDDARIFRINESIIDFRYFFTIDINELAKSEYLVSINDINRVNISRRFANYNSRIGLPNR